LSWPSFIPRSHLLGGEEPPGEEERTGATREDVTPGRGIMLTPVEMITLEGSTARGVMLDGGDEATVAGNTVRWEQCGTTETSRWRTELILGIKI